MLFECTKNQKFATNLQGFTLIELLVVISIIGLLASVILVSLSEARVKARDLRRRTDIAQLQKAIEMYYQDNGVYPTTSIFPAATYAAYLPVWNNELGGKLQPYLAKMPSPPLVKQTIQNYFYYGFDPSVNNFLVADNLCVRFAHGGYMLLTGVENSSSGLASNDGGILPDYLDAENNVTSVVPFAGHCP